MNFECPEIIGISNNIKNIRKLIERVAEMEVSVLIWGETGVGKELIVQNLYRRSKRCGKPFVKVNCAALPDALVESEMFGYEQGAFTGALNSKRGKFQQANGGVLFLDEIGDMPFSLQSKLLHALQSGEFSPLGAENIVRTDAWIIAATNRNLDKDMAENKFRSDLYYRLSTINIVMEPLRNRPEDIPYLVQNLIQKYAKQFNGKKITIPKKETISMLCSYSWPGNVRELQNVVKRIIVLGNEDKIIEELFDSDRIDTYFIKLIR